MKNCQSRGRGSLAIREVGFMAKNSGLSTLDGARLLKDFGSALLT